MARPVVREFNNLVTEIGKSVEPQKGLIDADISNNERSGAAQVTGMEAKKNETFGQIEQAAQNKGMFFSGFSPDEQAKYTSSTYLPALAALQAQIAQTRSSLMGKKADLDRDVYNMAFQTREGDVTAQRQWDDAESQRQWQAQQAEVEYQRQLQRDRENNAAEDRRAAASRAAQSAGPSNKELFASELAKSAGKDGKVAPGTYNALKNQWVSAGYGSFKDFHDSFWKFANDKHWWDYR